jgi:hypothetical protein
MRGGAMSESPVMATARRFILENGSRCRGFRCEDHVRSLRRLGLDRRVISKRQGHARPALGNTLNVDSGFNILFK